MKCSLQKPYNESKEKENGLNSKLKHIKVLKLFLCGILGDLYGRPGDWYYILEICHIWNLSGGWGGWYVPAINCKYSHFAFLRSRPCPCRYLTHLYVVCCHFIKFYVTGSMPCRLLEFYPTRTGPHKITTYSKILVIYKIFVTDEMQFFLILSKCGAELQNHAQKSPKVLLIHEIPLVSRRLIAHEESRRIGIVRNGIFRVESLVLRLGHPFCLLKMGTLMALIELPLMIGV